MREKLNDERFNIFGTRFSCLDLLGGYRAILEYDFLKPGYVCFPSIGLIVEANNNDDLQEIYNKSFITFADGKISEFYARLKGNKKTKNVSGFDLLNLLLKSNLSHYFYGLNGDDLTIFKQKIKSNFPDANILGFKSPPWIKSDTIYPDQYIQSDINQINSLKPDLVWIGISSPKQDYLMKSYVKHLNYGLMLGVGAVFLYQAGLVKIGPRWIKKIGLRWVVRLVQEPSRLWKRIISGIICFLYLVYKHDILLIKNKK